MIRCCFHHRPQVKLDFNSISVTFNICTNSLLVWCGEDSVFTNYQLSPAAFITFSVFKLSVTAAVKLDYLGEFKSILILFLSPLRVPLLQDGDVLLRLHTQLSSHAPVVPQWADAGHQAGVGDKGGDRFGCGCALRADDHAGDHHRARPQRAAAGQPAGPRRLGGRRTVSRPYSGVGASQRHAGRRHRRCRPHTSVAETLRRHLHICVGSHRRNAVCGLPAGDVYAARSGVWRALSSCPTSTLLVSLGHRWDVACYESDRCVGAVEIYCQRSVTHRRWVEFSLHLLMRSDSGCLHDIKIPPPVAVILPLWWYYRLVIPFFCSLSDVSQLHTKNIKNIPRSTDTENQGENLNHTGDAGLRHWNATQATSWRRSVPELTVFFLTTFHWIRNNLNLFFSPTMTVNVFFLPFRVISRDFRSTRWEQAPPPAPASAPSHTLWLTLTLRRVPWCLWLPPRPSLPSEGWMDNQTFFFNGTTATSGTAGGVIQDT